MRSTRASRPVRRCPRRHHQWRLDHLRPLRLGLQRSQRVRKGASTRTTCWRVRLLSAASTFRLTLRPMAFYRLCGDRTESHPRSSARLAPRDPCCSQHRFLATWWRSSLRCSRQKITWGSVPTTAAQLACVVSSHVGGLPRTALDRLYTADWLCPCGSFN